MTGSPGKRFNPSTFMRNKDLAAFLAIMILNTAMGVCQQIAIQNKSVVVNGRSGNVSVLLLSGRTFVDLQELASVSSGALTAQGGQLIVNLPSASESSSPSAPLATEQTDTTALSREFMKAGIEEINLLREWASPLANAIQNGYPISDAWVATYRGKATNGLHLASAAVSTSGDQNAYQLLSKEFNAVSGWSEHLVEAFKSMNAAQYSTSDTALREDPMSQKIVSCAHSLASMLANGVFQDDGSCQ